MVLVLGAMVVNAQRTQVKVSDLPKGVADSIQKEYMGYTIKESNKVVENNTTTYEVVILKGTQEKTLMFDNQGKSLKSKASGTVHDMDNSDKSKSDSWDNSTKTKTTPSSTSPSSTSPSSTSPSSSPSSTSPSTTSPK